LPVDFLEFFYLTPLPGSQDHQELFHKGAWMEPDLNKYDLFHVTSGHSTMSKADWERAYRLDWETYYTTAHIETILRRARQRNSVESHADARGLVRRNAGVRGGSRLRV